VTIAPPRRPRRPRGKALLLVGLVLVALNLRPALASVSPVLISIQRDLGLSRAAAGLLTTIPTLCMGLCAFVSARIGERVGLERGVLGSVALVGAATALRLAGHAAAALYLSALLVGVGIAVGQALLPAVVKRHFPDRATLVTGLYTVGFNIGAALAAGATVARRGAFGGSWRSRRWPRGPARQTVARGPARHRRGEARRRRMERACRCPGPVRTRGPWASSSPRRPASTSRC